MVTRRRRYQTTTRPFFALRPAHFHSAPVFSLGPSFFHSASVFFHSDSVFSALGHSVFTWLLFFSLRPCIFTERLFSFSPCIFTRPLYLHSPKITMSQRWWRRWQSDDMEMESTADKAANEAQNVLCWLMEIHIGTMMMKMIMMTWCLGRWIQYI